MRGLGANYYYYYYYYYYHYHYHYHYHYYYYYYYYYYYLNHHHHHHHHHSWKQVHRGAGLVIRCSGYFLLLPFWVRKTISSQKGPSPARLDDFTFAATSQLYSEHSNVYLQVLPVETCLSSFLGRPSGPFSKLVIWASK